MDEFFKKLQILRNEYLKAQDYEAYNACLVLSGRYLQKEFLDKN